MKKFWQLMAILFLAIAVLPLNAVIADDMQENTAYNRHIGPYAEGNIGKAVVWFNGEIGGNDFADSGFFGSGWSIGGGYMFKDWIGAEAGYLQFSPEADDDGDDPEIDVGGIYFAAKFNIPIKDRFSGIIKIGVMSLSASGDDDDFIAGGAPFTGIGVSYALTDKIDLRAQFQGPNLIFVGAGLLSGGVAYRF